MIRSFGSKDTERIWHEQYVEHVEHVDRTVQRATLRKLELIPAAKDVEDLRVPPGNRFVITQNKLAVSIGGRHPADGHQG